MKLEGHTDKVTSVAFSHDSQYLATGSFDKMINIWNLKTGDIFKSLDGHSKAVNSVAFSSNSEYLVSGSEDKSLIIWNFNTGKIDL